MPQTVRGRTAALVYGLPLSRSATVLRSAGLSLTLHACAVGMAARGHQEQDTPLIFPGSNRSVIIAKLGPPETARKVDDGKLEDSSLIKEGNESSSGRAWAHAGLDLLSLGLWEVMATPL
jgi:hypothetical protein